MPAGNGSGSVMSYSITGPPGAKTRGRPKLIGDDLDAELLDYLLDLRAKTTQRWTANTVLGLASEFIRKRAPGLLAEVRNPIMED